MASEAAGSAGQVLAGRYRLVALLGRGGMGCVWRAEHVTLGTPVAVKLIFPGVAARPGMVSRFLREAKAAATLRSVNVVQILDHGVDEGTPYIAMECLEGESLADRLKRERKLDAAGTALVMTGVCRALARAHRMGIVHRDLKPDNIFIANDEGGPVVKVLDFGIAKIVDPIAVDPGASTETNNRTQTGAVLGTPRYMSPEQMRGRAQVDGRSDLWSLAVIAFQCLTGRFPFDADALGELTMQVCAEPVPVPSSIAVVPAGFDAWFAQATQREPAQRFQAVQDFADALAAILTPDRRWLTASSEGEAPAPAAPGGGSDSDVTETMAPAMDRTGGAPPKRSPRGRVLWAGLAVALGGALGLASELRRDRAGTAGSAPMAGPEATLASSAGAPSATATPGPAVSPAAPPASAPPPEAEERRFLVILPSDASVEVDGAHVRSPKGVAEIAGKLGSVHHVRVFKGKAEVEGDVSITLSGVIPPKMDLAEARPKGGPTPVRPKSYDD
jgi:serine/threonine-protein kinase